MKKRANASRHAQGGPSSDSQRSKGQAVQASFPWLAGLAVFGLTWLAGVGLRLVELPMWLAGDFRVQGQWLMATHDAYHFLAGAAGISGNDGALPRLLRLLASITGASLSNIGFWLPVFVAPLAALPVCLVAARWRMPEAGLWAGLLAVAAPGYLQRTRIGFLDDDLLIIPLVLMLIAGFVLWLTPYCREAWGRSDGEEPKPTPWDAGLLLAGGLALGLWARLCVWAYVNVSSVVLAVVLTGLLLAAVLVRPGQRAAMAGACVLVLAGWLASWPLALAAMVCVWAVLFLVWPKAEAWNIRLPGSAVLTGLGLALVVAAAILARGLWLPMLNRGWALVKAYHAAVSAPETSQAMLLGGIAEAVSLPAWGTAQLLCGHWITAILAVAGFGLLLWKRPLAAMFLPLGAIALASFFLGARFTVISGAFFGLGLGCGLVLLLERFRVVRWQRVLALLLLLPLAFWYSWAHVQTMKPEPVVSPHQATALLKLRDIAAEDARIWNWWDLGHATLYYTARFAVERASPDGHYARAVITTDPQTLRQRLGRSEQYLVVSWELLGKVGSMIDMGSFDGARGVSTRQGGIQEMTGSFEFDLERGALVAPGQILPLGTLLMIEPQGPRRHSWPWNPQGGHVALNLLDRTGFFMDRTVYETMFVQMLLAPGGEFEDDFELVVDDFPWVRVYRVRDGR